ncbi:HIT family protein [Cohaesibacter celericrescens]|jgi:diadenosine tetraphosphate (Ap4A) HIT family hydrolase|uniref:Diadenosine tetraphosphate hydrolase n=1 Tax=Cohaesibacter celericrescens TaxID=2067669 RepID=A0A2N5XN16_9HYPH|nr:HIT family protein [Cohaesibacter celericrescens]PLW75808.1 diadenosine tetraphosphate hydrolase [Cohaesibacter celericrescens]
MVDFILDPQLKADSLPLAELELCTVRLMNDTHFPWLLMVPKYNGLEELIDLARQDQHRLMDEMLMVSNALQDATGCDKLNVAALGNMVRQLHVHVVARFEGDAAWPGPIWGKVPMHPYEEAKANNLITTLQTALL